MISAPLGRYVVLVPLRRLPPALLDTVAARAGSDPAAVRRAAALGNAWAVGEADLEDDALRVAARFTAEGMPATVATTVAPRVIQYLLLAAVAAIVGLVSGVTVPFLALAGVLVVMALINFRAMWPVAEARLAAQEARRHAADP